MCKNGTRYSLDNHAHFCTVTVTPSWMSTVCHLHDVSRGVLLRLPPGRNYGTNTGPTWERTAVFSWWLRISVLSDPSGILLCVKVAIYIMFPLVYFCATPKYVFLDLKQVQNEGGTRHSPDNGAPLYCHCHIRSGILLIYVKVKIYMLLPVASF